MVDTGTLSNNMKSSLWNVTLHSGAWPYTVTPFICQTYRLFVTSLSPYWTLLPTLAFFTEFREVSIEHMQRVRHANRGRLLLWAPGPVPFYDLHVFLRWNQSLPNLWFFSTSCFKHPSVLLFCLQKCKMYEDCKLLVLYATLFGFILVRFYLISRIWFDFIKSIISPRAQEAKLLRRLLLICCILQSCSHIESRRYQNLLNRSSVIY